MQTHLADWIRGTAQGDEAEAILRKCVHCGFCLATCPTYNLLGDELDSPRGRIYLMKQMLEGAREGCTQPASATMRRAWRAGGQAGASRERGILRASERGSTGRAMRPSARPHANSCRRGSVALSTRRHRRWPAGRGTRSSTTSGRKASSRR